PLLVVALGALVGVLAVIIAWALDSRAHDHAVLPNVVLAGKSVRGMQSGELTALAQETAARFANDSVLVKTRSGAGGFETTAPGPRQGRWSSPWRSAPSGRISPRRTPTAWRARPSA